MYGYELSFCEVNWKARLFYLLLGADHWGDRIRASHLLGVLKTTILPGHVVLDAGSGGGAQAFFLARRFPKSRFKGVELNHQSVATCNKILTRLRGAHNLEFYPVNLLDLDSVGEFDVVYSVDVLEHIEDDQRVLRNLYRALRDGGVLVLHVPARGDKAIDEIDDCGKAIGHVRSGYSRGEIVERLRDAGFEVMQIRNTFGRLGSTARRLYYFTESQPGWCRWFLKLAFFPLCYLFGCGDTLLEDRRNTEGVLVKARKPA